MKKKTEKYSQALLELEGSKVLANLVMAIASDVQARSIVEYSASALFHYQYSSISQMFIRLVDGELSNVASFQRSVESFVLSWQARVPDFAVGCVVRTALDVTPIKKPHSACLADRQFVYTPNETIKGNKPIEIGYPVSSLNLGFAPKWSVIASFLRVESTETGVSVGVKQLKTLANSAECAPHLVVNSADSGYSHAAFFAPLYAQKNLVNVVRLKTCNVWDWQPCADTGGTPQVYGDGYHLRRAAAVTKYKNPKTGELAVPKPSIGLRVADQTETYETTTQRGKVLKITLYLHKNMMKRSKKEHNMKDKPFDLVIVEVWDKEKDKPLYSKPMYLAVAGQRRSELSLRDTYEAHYAHRYDIEPNNRFIKQQLLLEKFGTPHVTHFDIWLSVMSLVETLLLLASTDLSAEDLICKYKWQRRLAKTTEVVSTEVVSTEVVSTEVVSEEVVPTEIVSTEVASEEVVPTRPTIAATRKAAERLFLTFDKKPFLPQKSKKGKGRKTGTKLLAKSKHSVVRKAKKVQKIAVKDTKT